MSAELTGKRIAILATDGVEGVELTSPREALESAGATVEILAPKGDSYPALGPHGEGRRLARQQRSSPEADAMEYDGLVLPGGVRNADHLRLDTPSVLFVTALARRGVPIGVICHGAWILIEARAVNGRTLTSYPSLRTDLRERGRRLGRPGGRERRRPRVQPATRRSACVQRRDRRGRSPRACTSAVPPETVDGVLATR